MTVTSPAPPTHARYWVIVFAVTAAILAYIDRVCISQAAPEISRELRLSKIQMGSIFSAFALAYALFEIPFGWLGDRIGARKTLSAAVILWSSFTAVTGWMWGATSMWMARFLFGAAQAGCFPNIAKAFGSWLPGHERVRAFGIMWTFARWGGAFTPPLVVVALGFMNWRAAFMLFGSVGLLWTVVFYSWYRDDPRERREVNALELQILEEARQFAPGHGDVPWAKFVSSPRVWLLWGQYFSITFPWYFYITWLPTYLQEARHLSAAASARYAVLPLLFGGFGTLSSGFLAARVARWTGGTAAGRRALGTFGCLGASLVLILSINLESVLWAMLAMGLAGFCNDLPVPGAWGACMDMGGKHAGTLSGSMNMMGNLAGFVAPVLGGYLLRWSGGNWNLLLYTMAAVYMLGVVCWPLLDPVKPLEEPVAAAMPA
jgi:ACS family glucarate transporter-like MFS transporter